MNFPPRSRIGEWAILLLVGFSVLWKGGKSLESTWLLAGLGAVLTIHYWFTRFHRVTQTAQADGARGPMNASNKNEISVFLHVSALLYVAWSVIAYAFSQTSNYGLDEVFRTCGYMLIFLWIARMRIERGSKHLEESFPILLSVIAVIATLAGIIVYSVQPVNRFVGTFFDFRFATDYWPNAWAEFVLIAWPMLLYVSWAVNGDRKKWGAYLALGFLLSALALSYSRGAMLAFVGQCAVIGVLFTPLILNDIRYKRIKGVLLRTLLIRSLAVCATVILLFAGINGLRSLSYPVQSVTEKVTFTASEGRSSIDERAQFWSHAKKLLLEKPIVGYGPYSFRFVQPQYMNDVLATSDHPHNVLLKLAMERGIPAAVLFIAVFGGVLSLAIVSFLTRRKAASGTQDVFAVMGIAAITGVFLHNMIDYNLQFVGIGLSAVVCLGLIVVPAKTIASDSMQTFKRWRVKRILSRMDLLIAVITLLLVTWEGIFLLTSSFGRHALAGGDEKSALAWFERSRMELFSRDMLLSEADIYMHQKNYDKATDALDRYIARNTYDARVWKMQGELKLRESDEQGALSSITEAYRLGKYTDLGIMRLLIDSLRRNEDPSLYLSRKLEFDALFIAYSDAILHNTHFIALSQNVEELQTVSRILAQLYPTDADRYKSIARDALAHAKEERNRFTARKPGILW